MDNKSTFFGLRKSCVFSTFFGLRESCLFLFFILFSLKGFSASETFSTGSFIINMGVVPQTQSNGLKPYALIYDLKRNWNVPIKWSINQTQGKDGTDFTYINTAGTSLQKWEVSV